MSTWSIWPISLLWIWVSLWGESCSAWSQSHNLALSDAEHAGNADSTLDALEAEWKQIASDHAQAEAVRVYVQRLELVDQVLIDLRQGFERQRSAALLDLLDETLNTPEVTVESSAMDPAITADQLLARYQPSFASPLTTSGLTPEAIEVMRKLYESRLRRATDEISERGRSVAAANPEDAVKAISFSLVIPLLHISDGNWSVEEVRNLPEWLQSPELMASLENIALRLHRPLTAWSFARVTSLALTSQEDTHNDPSVYLSDTTERLLREGRFDEAVTCLRSLLSRFESPEGTPAADIRFRLAQVLADIGEPAQAAQTLAPLVGPEIDEADVFGRAVMLGLKYRYEAEDFEKLFTLSDAYRNSESIGDYRPQVLYITWVAARRDNRPHLAASVRESFLGDYASHALAADMYFAEAMEALARSDYEEAQRLFEYISYRYPDSRLIERVKEIQERLADQ